MDDPTLTQTGTYAGTQTGTETGAQAVERLGGYRIEGLLGKGGMGEVYAAVDERLQRAVALKRIRPSRAGAEARARFWREARALAALNHPGIVTIYEIGETPDGGLFLAMERVEGLPLSEYLAGPWPPALVAWVGARVAEALGAAHTAGITHRDIKPSNLMIAPDGSPKLVDFGIARRACAEDQLTQTGARVGTPAYMAPEQIEGGAVGPGADIFALGSVLFRLLTAVHPFARDSARATALAVSASQRPDLETLSPDTPPKLRRLIERCLELAPADRPADGVQLAEALHGIVSELGAPAAERRAAWLDAVEGRPLSLLSTPPKPHPGPRPNGRRRAVFGAALIGLGLGLGGWLLGSRSGPSKSQEPEIPNPPAGVLATQIEPPPVLPTRPVVFAVQPGRSATERIYTDVLRVCLATTPQALIVAPGTAVEAGLPPDLKQLTRPRRGLGNVDVLLETTLGDGAAQLRLRRVPDGATFDTFEVKILDSSPIALARAVALEAQGRLGVSSPIPCPALTRSTEAYAALLDARAATATADNGAAKSNLDWALRLDPQFLLAQLEQLPRLRALRRFDALAKAAKRLSSAELPPREAALAAAYGHLGAGDVPGALQQLGKLLQDWPLDVQARDLLLAIRMNDPRHRDLNSVERLARAQLQVAPRNETAASRLLRVLAWRGRFAEARAVIGALGVPPDDPQFAEVFAELDLMTNAPDRAVERFDRARRLAPGNLYAEHMGFAARILSGDCDRAALDTLARIDRVESSGKDSNLDWTYSLATQALICRESWAALDTLARRWSQHSASGRAQSAALLRRVELLRGKTRAQVALGLERALAKTTNPTQLATLFTQTARVEVRINVLKAARTRAHEAAVDPSTAAPLRAQLLRAQNALKAAVLLHGPGPERSLSLLREQVFPFIQLQSEADLGARVEAMVRLAEALDTLGYPQEAAQQWRAIVDLGYARLWVTDLWVTAKRRLEEAQ